MTQLKTKHIAMLLLCAGVLVSCRGQISEKPPIHPQQNMDFQNRFEAQEENPFFADGRANRLPVEGTISRGNLRDDSRYYEGIDENGELIDEIPVPVTMDLLNRGRERYDIYCSVCHGGVGNGDGPVMVGGFGFFQYSLHLENVRALTDGGIYSAIYNGARTMPSYRSQIPVQDRWAIVAYVRALQESQNQTEDGALEYGMDSAELSALQTAAEAGLVAQQQEEATQAEAATNDTLADNTTGPSEADIAALVETGRNAVTTYGCIACHSSDGSAIVAPSFLNLFNHDVPLDDGSTVVADEEYLLESITEPTAKVVEGYAPVMPPFGYIPEAEQNAIVEYIKSLSEN